MSSSIEPKALSEPAFVATYCKAVHDPNFVLNEPIISKIWGEYGDWQLVGHEPLATNEHCGTHAGLAVCSDLEGHNMVTIDGVNHRGKVAIRHIIRHCHSYGCPRCFKDGAIFRESDRASGRLLKGAKSFGKPEHLTVSLSVKDSCGLSLESYRRKAEKALLARGVIGGCLIVHAFRYHSRREALLKGGSMGWYFSMHFHSIGYIEGSYARCRCCPHNCETERKFCLSCDGFEGRTRRHWKHDHFIVKVARDRTGVAGERKSVKKTLQYIMSHCSIKKSAKRATPLTWFGVISCRKMKFEYVPHKEKCWICGGEMKPALYIGKHHIETDVNSPNFERRLERDFFENGVCTIVEKCYDRLGRDLGRVSWDDG